MLGKDVGGDTDSGGIGDGNNILKNKTAAYKFKISLYFEAYYTF